jgi:Flavin-binding monooxygenase-like
MKGLREQGLGVEGFERGSDVGGLWRYENDSGLSAAYSSLRTNVSRPRMQYPSFAMPNAYGDFPSHREMAAYLGAYADAYGLRDSIRFRTRVERLEPAAAGTWRVTLDDGSRRSHGAVVVATGLFWSPRLPFCPGSFDGTVSHSHEYRTPEPYAGRRVLVVGAGQSAAEIAVEVSTVAERTFMSIRGGVHVIPRWIGRRPYDAADIAPLNRMPWRLLNLIYGLRVTRALGARPASWPLPAHPPLEGIPIVSSEFLPAVRRGDVVVKPAIDQLSGSSVHFMDESEERIDRIVYATGYRINFPYLSPLMVSADGRDLPLYRRMVRPGLPGSTSPDSSTRREDCCRWSRPKASGSPPPSPDSSACPRQSECGRQSNTRNRAPASGSRTKAHAAFAVTRTPTYGSYTPTCGEHGGRH